MALQAIGGRILSPYYQGAHWTFSSLVMDAAGEKVGYTFKVPKTGSLTHIAFRTGTIISPQTLRVGVETLDASGNPSTTQYGGSAVGTQALPASATTYEVELATPASATLGDDIAAVIQWDLLDGSVNIAAMAGGFGSNGYGFPYLNHFTSAWAHSTSIWPIMSVKIDGAYYDIGCFPAGNYATVTFHSGTTPDEIGNLFNLPFTCEVAGAWGICDLDGPADFVLYDSDGSTVLSFVSTLAAVRGSTLQSLHVVPFAPVELAKATNYRLVLKPTSTTNIIANRATFLTAAHQDGWALGQNCHETSRANAGAWTETTTQRISIGLLISKLDDGVGSGGGLLRHPGMTGGMNA